MDALSLTSQHLASKLQALYDSVPFGMSDYQLEHMVTNHLSPSRSRRQVLLELHQRQRSLQENEFRLEELAIDLEEARYITETDEDRFKRAKAEIKVRRCLFEQEMVKTLHRDCQIECVKLFEILAQLPEASREEFEAGERAYWHTRLTHEAALQVIATGRISEGHLQAITQLGINPYEISAGLEADTKAHLAAARESVKVIAEESQA